MVAPRKSAVGDPGAGEPVHRPCIFEHPKDLLSGHGRGIRRALFAEHCEAPHRRAADAVPLVFLELGTTPVP